MNRERKEFIYLGWNCLVYENDGNWYYRVSYTNGTWKRQGNAFSEAGAIMFAFKACEGLGECHD